jgi:hypothetical protein
VEVTERVADGAVDLRDAAERVRILDLVMGPVMGRLQPGVAEERPQLGRHRDLARVRPRQLVGGGERDVRAEERLDAHRRDRARRPDQAVRIRQEERPQRRHQLRPVEESEPLLRAKGQRLQPDLAKREEGGRLVAVQLHRSAADQREGEMGQRREVA